MCFRKEQRATHPNNLINSMTDTLMYTKLKISLWGEQNFYISTAALSDIYIFTSAAYSSQFRQSLFNRLKFTVSHFTSKNIFQLLYQLACAAINKAHRLNDLKTRDINLFAIPEAESPRSRYSRTGFWHDCCSWLADNCLLTVSSQSLSSVCMLS